MAKDRLDEKVNTDIETRAYHTTAVPGREILVAIEELREKHNTPIEIFEGLKVFSHWGIGSRTTERQYLKQLDSFLKGTTY